MDSTAVKIGFRQEVLEIPIDQLVPLKEVALRIESTRKYKEIKASLEHIGVIEPLAVFPQNSERYLVTNGNLRLYILRQLKVESVRCLVAFEDESYTYNKRINALSPITEHFMLLKAIANGVTPERIALGLNINVEGIRVRTRLLDGICPEAVKLLRDKRVGVRAFACLKKMKPLRQIEAAELMLSGNNYTGTFAGAILGVTNQEQLMKSDDETVGPQTADGSLIAETTDLLVGDLALVRKTYGIDVLTLTVICRSIETLIGNEKVCKYLQKNHFEVLEELRKVITEVKTERAVA